MKTFANASFADTVRLSSVGKVYIINGSVGSGKSTYVKDHKDPDDIVLDIDHMRQALSYSDNLYEGHSDISMSLSVLIRDYIMSLRDSVLLSGRNIWFIISESDPVRISGLVEEYSAEYVFLAESKDECIRHILNDDRRLNKKMHLQAVDEWFDADTDHDVSSDLDVIIDHYNDLISFLDEHHVDYFVTGSFAVYLDTGVMPERMFSDIDIYVNSIDLRFFVQYCGIKGFDWIDCITNKNRFIDTGHCYYYKPFDKSDFHVGVIPFGRDKDGVFVHKSYRMFMTLLHVCCVRLSHGSSLTRLLDKNAVNRVLPCEYVFLYKLMYGRLKDFKYYLLIRNHFRYTVYLKFKESFKDCNYHEYVYLSDGSLKLVDSGIID